MILIQIPNPLPTHTCSEVDNNIIKHFMRLFCAIICSMLYEQQSLSRTAQTAAAISSASALKSSSDTMQCNELQRVLGG